MKARWPNRSALLKSARSCPICSSRTPARHPAKLFAFTTNKKKQRMKVIPRFQQYEGANKIGFTSGIRGRYQGGTDLAFPSSREIFRSLWCLPRKKLPPRRPRLKGADDCVGGPIPIWIRKSAVPLMRRMWTMWRANYLQKLLRCWNEIPARSSYPIDP